MRKILNAHFCLNDSHIYRNYIFSHYIITDQQWTEV